MRIIFVRHGEPDYGRDCLTELGKRQAEACRARLAGEPIAAIYSSTNGRAAETAEYIAAPHALTVERLDFMRELGWKILEGEPLADGLPWNEADAMVARGMRVLDADWAVHEPFCRNSTTARALFAAEEFDKLLLALGYRREGGYYRVLRENTDTVAVVSHGGSSSAVIAHMLGLPFPFVLATLHPEFTSVTVLSLPNRVGALVTPTVQIMNDAGHISGIEGMRQYR